MPRLIRVSIELCVLYKDNRVDYYSISTQRERVRKK